MKQGLTWLPESMYQQFVDTAGDLDVQIQSYSSGRAMYGKECVAVVADSERTISRFLGRTITSIFSDVISDALDIAEEDDAGYAAVHERSSTAQRFIEFILADQRSDDMGLGVVAYWPEWAVSDTTVDDDDDSV